MSPVGNTYLETDLIRTFVAISETGSFTRAADRVLRTPSAVSMQMKRLEEQLGRKLFVKQGRSVALTADGEALLGYGRQMLRINEEAVSRFLVPPVEGCVRFGAPDDFGTRFLPNILSRFAASHPMVEVNVVLGPSVELLRQLAGEQIDLTLVTSGEAEAGLPHGKTVYSEPLVWVGVKDGRAKDADPVPVALAGRGCCWRAAALEALDGARRKYRIAYTCENCQGQLAALLADLAVAPLPESIITQEYEQLGPAQGFPNPGHYEVRLCKSSRIGAAAEAFAAHVEDSFAGLRL